VSAAGAVGFRLSVGGVDNSTANSYGRNQTISTTATSTSQYSAGANGLLGDIGTSAQLRISMSNPARPVVTFLLNRSYASNGTRTEGSNHHSSSIIFDGFSIYPVTAAATFNGSARVYGLNNY
jgi:hypothetical protein